MIKKLDILIIRSFIGPFIVTFFVALFVLVMQFFWLYMDELLGKGFGIWTILQLLFYMSSTMVPLALPLGILLASIMTFGNMGEAFELVAIKSSGISLLRFMRPLLFTICAVGGLAFFFNNNVIPVANLKAFSLLYDLRNAKMSLNIRAGQFNNDIPGFAIKIGEKGKDEKTIKNVIIYEGGDYGGNNKVVLAKSGEMSASPDGKYINFKLKDGWRYEEATDKEYQNYGVHATQTRMHFASYDKVIDLAALKLNRTNEDLFKSGYQMMNWKQLLADMDQIKKSRAHDVAVGEANFSPFLPLYSKLETGKKFRAKLDSLQPTELKENKATKPLYFLPDSLRNTVIESAMANARNALQLTGYTATNVNIQDENLVKREIAFFSKFTLSFACVLLFLIGAPLGAIIRKGGLGMPVVVGVAFFVIYFILSKTGEQLTQSRALPAWLGMWFSTIMLLPIAFFMIRQARNDSPIFSREWYSRKWNALKSIFSKKTAHA
ncbi:MAG: LptF/LptG family permease [Bacteroidetes bacterium]|nr:LptF/LptG family permease [Bacteroidota bacterium]